ncbi:MAG: hypothetical protein KY464_00950 [Gemmatimonadetes bacterium]|nr:hypothetical protein [Gemmatimonadota bacterium]
MERTFARFFALSHLRLMRRPSLFIFFLAALGSPLAAQTIPSPYRFIERSQGVSLYTGYVVTERGSLDLGPHSAPTIGLEYAGRFAGPIAGTVGVSYMPTKRTVHEFSGASALTPLADVDAHLIQAEAGLEFTLTGPRTWHSLAPFIGATGGLIADLAGRSRVETEAELPEDQLVKFGPSFAVGASAGIDWFLTERLSIRGLARGHLWRFTTPAGLAGREENEWLTNGGGTLGVAFHF